MNNNVIVLSAEEIAIATYLGRRRSALMDARRHESSFYANGGKNGSSLQDNILGVVGELAFCKIYNVYPDLAIEYHGQHDAVVFGLSYDIKAVTAGQQLNLIVPRHKLDNSADYYVLVEVDLHQAKAWIVGAATASDVFNRRNWRDDLPVPAYFIRRDQLHPLGRMAVLA